MYSWTTQNTRSVHDGWRLECLCACFSYYCCPLFWFRRCFSAVTHLIRLHFNGFVSCFPDFSLSLAVPVSHTHTHTHNFPIWFIRDHFLFRFHFCFSDLVVQDDDNITFEPNLSNLLAQLVFQQLSHQFEFSDPLRRTENFPETLWFACANFYKAERERAHATVNDIIVFV